MSATMVRRGGRVQLEQSDMRLVLNIAIMAKGGFPRASIEETQQMIKRPSAKVREEMNRGVEFPRHTPVQAAIERHTAVLCQKQHSQMTSFLNWHGKASHRCVGDAQEQVHLHPTEAASWLQSRCHLFTEHHPPHLVTMAKINIPKLTVC